MAPEGSHADPADNADLFGAGAGLLTDKQIICEIRVICEWNSGEGLAPEGSHADPADNADLFYADAGLLADKQIYLRDPRDPRALAFAPLKDLSA